MEKQQEEIINLKNALFKRSLSRPSIQLDEEDSGFLTSSDRDGNSESGSAEILSTNEDPSDGKIPENLVGNENLDSDEISEPRKKRVAKRSMSDDSDSYDSTGGIVITQSNITDMQTAWNSKRDSDILQPHIPEKDKSEID